MRRARFTCGCVSHTRKFWYSIISLITFRFLLRLRCGVDETTIYLPNSHDKKNKRMQYPTLEAATLCFGWIRNSSSKNV